jgi:hypothetical protein
MQTFVTQTDPAIKAMTSQGNEQNEQNGGAHAFACQDLSGAGSICRTNHFAIIQTA